MKTAFRVLFTLMVLSLAAVAQSENKNDLGLLLGGFFVPQRSTAGGEAINFGASIAFSADYARRIKSGNTSISIEFPFVAEPSNSVRSINQQSIVSLATIFVVPSLRVNFVSNGGIFPWVSGGFGFGISEGSEFFANGKRNPSRYQSTGAAQFGAGVDVRTPIKVFFPVSLRGEVRDYYSVSNPTFGTAVQGGGQHNVVVREAWFFPSKRLVAWISLLTLADSRCGSGGTTECRYRLRSAPNAVEETRNGLNGMNIELIIVPTSVFRTWKESRPSLLIQPSSIGSKTPNPNTRNHTAGAGVPSGRNRLFSRAAIRGSSISQRV
jgi:hypothetical protein